MVKTDIEKHKDNVFQTDIEKHKDDVFQRMEMINDFSFFFYIAVLLVVSAVSLFLK